MSGGLRYAAGMIRASTLQAPISCTANADETLAFFRDYFSRKGLEEFSENTEDRIGFYTQHGGSVLHTLVVVEDDSLAIITRVVVDEPANLGEAFMLIGRLNATYSMAKLFLIAGQGDAAPLVGLDTSLRLDEGRALKGQLEGLVEQHTCMVGVIFPILTGYFARKSSFENVLLNLSNM